MQNQPNPIISSQRATDLLKSGQQIIGAYIGGEIKILGESDWSTEILISDCIVEYFEGSVSTFSQPVKFINTHFKDCKFTFSFFLKGLIIENCTFDSYLDLQSGGHSQIRYPIIIKNNKFLGFVNFFDCWYKTDVFITGNTFFKGTNIESKTQLITFDVPPVISNNTGQTNIEAEDQ